MSTDRFRVELPGGGGGIHLQSVEEVDRWTTLANAYQSQYDLKKINDLTNLATLLVEHINLYRAQQALSGRVPEIDDDDLPTGNYVSRVLKPAEIKMYQEQTQSVGKRILEIERAMQIDKASRDKSGDESAQAWLRAMKAKAHRYGLHVSGRVKAYEEFVMELRWRLRLNLNGDAEDKNYEKVSDADIIQWAREQLAVLEEKDKKFAADEGALVIGRAP